MPIALCLQQTPTASATTAPALYMLKLSNGTRLSAIRLIQKRKATICIHRRSANCSLSGLQNSVYVHAGGVDAHIRVQRGARFGGGLLVSEEVWATALATGSKAQVLRRERTPTPAQRALEGTS